MRKRRNNLSITLHNFVYTYTYVYTDFSSCAPSFQSPKLVFYDHAERITPPRAFKSEMFCEQTTERERDAGAKKEKTRTVRQSSFRKSRSFTLSFFFVSPFRMGRGLETVELVDFRVMAFATSFWLSATD